MEIIYLHSKKLLYMQIVVGILSCWIFGLGLLIILFAWLVYKSESLTLSKTSIVVRKGIVSHSEIEIPYNKVNSINIYKDPVGVLLGVGNIGIFSANSTTAEVF